MSRRDVFHNAVRRALEKEDWTITHDPYSLAFGERTLLVDLWAEAPLAAEKEGRKIAVEVKSFVGKSEVVELEKAIGQFILYEDAWLGLLSGSQSAKVIERCNLRLIVYNPIEEKILLWKD